MRWLVQPIVMVSWCRGASCGTSADALIQRLSFLAFNVDLFSRFVFVFLVAPVLDWRFGLSSSALAQLTEAWVWYLCWLIQPSSSVVWEIVLLRRCVHSEFSYRILERACSVVL